MNQPKGDELLRQIRDRLSWACVVLAVILLFVAVPELWQLHIVARLCVAGLLVGVVWYIRWLQEIDSIEPAEPEKSVPVAERKAE